MVAHVTSMAFGCNLKSLDINAEECETKIWAGITIPESKVRDYLTFLNEEQFVSAKYTTSQTFEILYNDITRKLSNSNFLAFARACKNVYESDDSLQKTAVHMLLKKVSDKILKHQEILKKLQNLKKKDQDATLPDYKKNLQLFLNADKNINVY